MSGLRRYRVGLCAWLALWSGGIGAAGAKGQAPSDGVSDSTVAFWTRVAECETGGAWRGLGSVYQGGLGIYYRTWDWWAKELGLWSQYPDAGLAPRLVQIRVADYGRRIHRGYWGCL